MSLYKKWLNNAYNQKGESLPSFWNIYMPMEQKVYEQLISTKTTTLKGSLKDLAESFAMKTEHFIGFLDGLTDVFNEDIKVDELTATSKLDLSFEFKTMFQKMVEYKAVHLYTLKEWENVFSKEELDSLYKSQKQSTTIVKEAKIGRNDPCTCGSGKKYKKCCGAN